MPDDNNEVFDDLEITQDEIIDAEALENTEPADEAEIEEIAVAAEPEPEQSADGADEIEPESGEPDDAVIAALEEIRGRLDKAAETYNGLLARIEGLEKREAARNKKLTGFFAPITDGRDPDPGVDPLPRIEKKYIF